MGEPRIVNCTHCSVDTIGRHEENCPARAFATNENFALGAQLSEARSELARLREEVETKQVIIDDLKVICEALRVERDEAREVAKQALIFIDQREHEVATEEDCPPSPLSEHIEQWREGILAAHPELSK